MCPYPRGNKAMQWPSHDKLGKIPQNLQGSDAFSRHHHNATYIFLMNPIPVMNQIISDENQIQIRFHPFASFQNKTMIYVNYKGFSKFAFCLIPAN
jgi:hypothetical protein